MKFPIVKVEMPNGPVTAGTKIFVDGVEQHNVYKAVLTLQADDVARLELHTFAEVHIEGGAVVETIHVCPECKQQLTKDLEPGYVATVDISNLSDKWIRRFPVATKASDV